MSNLSIKYRPIVLFLSDDNITAYEFAITDNKVAVTKIYQPKDNENFHFKNAILIINTSDVITSDVVSENSKDALDEAFPAIRPSDIYFDYQSLERNRISIIKKSSLRKILDKHNISEKFISQIRLASSLEAALKLDRIPTDEEIAEIGVGLTLKELTGKNNFQELEESFSSALFNKRFFEITKWSAIAIFLIGLMINFIYHEQFRKELRTAKITAQSYKDIDAKTADLKERVNANQLLVNSDNSKDINRLRMINELLLFDYDIRFKTITYQPLKSRLKADQAIRLEENKITLNGASSSRIKLDEYLEFLNKNEMIDQVSVVSLLESSKTTDFELLIYLNASR